MDLASSSFLSSFFLDRGAELEDTGGRSATREMGLTEEAVLETDEDERRRSGVWLL